MSTPCIWCSGSGKHTICGACADRGEAIGMKPPPWSKFMLARNTHKDPRFVMTSKLGSETWMNSRYVVDKTPAGDGPWGPMVELSIKRIDKQAIHDWRDFQRIKNELVGPEAEALEMYPAESRLVDTANQYYLMCFPEIPGKGRVPWGFDGRLVAEGSTYGSGQRDFEEKPTDLTSDEDFARIIEDWAKDQRADQ